MFFAEHTVEYKMDNFEDKLDRSQVMSSVGDINKEIVEALKNNNGQVDENITKLYNKRLMQGLLLSVR